MKKVLKFLGIVLLMAISFLAGMFFWEFAPEDERPMSYNEIMNGVSNETSNRVEENKKSNVDESERKIVQGNVLYYEDDEYVVDTILFPDEHNYVHQITKSEMDFIHDQKDSSYEIPINYNGYTEDELTNLILSTSVFVGYIEDGYQTKYSNGNIYDIDENYIYIICSNHGVSNRGVYNVDNVKLRFVNNEVIKPIHLRNGNFGDFALLVVDKKDVSNELLNVIHSINTKNLYQTIEEDTVLYGYMYVIPAYKQYTAIIDYLLPGPLRLKDSDLENGTSGGGMFDIYGNYYGTVKNKTALSYVSLFPNFYNYIVEFNPQYGEPLGEIIAFN